MRASELILEDSTDTLQSDIADIFAIAAGSGLSKIPTDYFIRALKSKGYNASLANVEDILQDMAGVASVDPDKITLADADQDATAIPSSPEDSNSDAEKVSKMAQDATHIGK